MELYEVGASVRRRGGRARGGADGEEHGRGGESIRRPPAVKEQIQSLGGEFSGGGLQGIFSQNTYIYF